MKYIILTLCLLASVSSYAQSSDFNYNEVVEVPNTSKNELYARAMAWINEAFVSSKAVIQSQDKEEGTIYGTARFILEDRKDFKSEVNYSFRIDVKDNKFRYTFKDYTYKDEYPEHSRGPMALTMEDPDTKRMTKKYWEKTKASALPKTKNQIASLVQAMNKKTSDW